MKNKSVRFLNKGISYKIEVSDKPNKKLMGTYTDKNGKEKVLYFGGVRDNGQLHEHYFDKTGLLDKSLNHKDPIRRKSFLARFKYSYNGEPNALTLSTLILW